MDDSLFRRMIDSSLVPTALVGLDGRLFFVNRAMCDFVGRDAGWLIGRTWDDLRGVQDRSEADADGRDDVIGGLRESYRTIEKYVHADGRVIWGDLTVVCLRDDDGRVQTLISQIVDVTDEVRSRTELEESRRELLLAAERYRKMIDNSIIPAALSRSDGSLETVNQAMCDFLGYGAEALVSMTWMDLVAPEDLDEGYRATQELISGQRDSYRGKQQLIHADGRRLFGDLSMACNRDAEGRFENIIAQIIDITEQVQSRDRLIRREAQLSSEIASAARYIESLLPGPLTGGVEVSSRYLPSLEVGGDCFHYRWLDDDIFEIYLIDVSGHGVRPALLSVSVHNMIRSGSMPLSTLLRPDRVLAKLNSLFQMEQQDDAYFSMWYGIYECSSRTLRYATAGSPPALVFHPTPDGEWQHTALVTTSVPVGMFTDSKYHNRTYTVPAGGRMLLFSDGAFELPLPGGRTGTLGEFTGVVCDQLRNDDFSAPAIVEQLRARTVEGQFEDDCSLIAVDFC